MTRKEVLFLQGAGAGAHEEDRALADSLGKVLGDGYHVRYPKLPNDGDAEYAAVRPVIARELAAMSGDVILVGHSAGGAVFMKYLSEEPVPNEIAGVFLIAAPYFGDGGWVVDDGALREDFAAGLPKRTPIFFYHSRDDEVVPFAHLALYARALPLATVREFNSRGHQFKNDLSEVAADIQRLAKQQ